MHYLTVSKAAQAEYVVSRSRFIGYIKPIDSVESADGFVDEIRALHPQARHNVYAYCVRTPVYTRFSDDGEPQGTAGKPVLDVLKNALLTDVCLVVTRYFGGILLGTGGLVRAYSHTASLAAEAAGIVRMRSCAVYELKLDYTLYGGLQRLLPRFEASVGQTDFSQQITMDVCLPLENEAGFLKAVAELSLGKVHPQRTGERFCAAETEKSGE